MFSFNEGLLGILGPYNREFLLPGEEVKYLSSLKTQPEDWLYRTSKVHYDLNEYGHRAKSINDIKNDYILFTGCSNTFGYGLKLEDIYVHKLAQKLNMDYYNLAVPGGTVKICMINLLSFLNKVKNKPKKIVIQWPEFNRTVFYHNDSEIFLYSHKFNPGPQEDSRYDSTVYDTLLKYNIPYTESVFHRKIILDNLTHLHIDTYEMSSDFSNSLDDHTSHRFIKLPSSVIDVARDLEHPGVKTHDYWVENLLKIIKK